MGRGQGRAGERHTAFPKCLQSPTGPRGREARHSACCEGRGIMITDPVRQIAEPKVQCRMLYSKWMFIEAEPDPTGPRSGASICLCVRTQKCMGPDGQVVTREACNAQRTCFEAL